jgi:hypothetical protein
VDLDGPAGGGPGRQISVSEGRAAIEMVRHRIEVGEGEGEGNRGREGASETGRREGWREGGMESCGGNVCVHLNSSSLSAVCMLIFILFSFLHRCISTDLNNT